MNTICEKERLLGVLKGEKQDRPPVICPGGMMNAAVTEVLKDIKGNHNCSKEAMVLAAKKVRELTGFENYGVPFCMTVEAEPFGIKVDLGDKNTEPRVTKYNELTTEEIIDEYSDIKDSCRMSVVLDAISELKNDLVPVIGNITGPISTATSIVDPLKLIKMLRKEPEQALSFISFVNDNLIKYAIDMVKHGADVITLSDPTATGEILGKRNFEKFAVPMYKKLTGEIHKLHTPVIIHICGDTTSIFESLNLIGADAFSFDSIVNIKTVKEKITAKIMGNVSTQLLQQGPEERITGITRNCLKCGTDIVSPACGLSMSTSIENLKTMTNYVKGAGFHGNY